MITDYIVRNWYKWLLCFIFCVVTAIACACAWNVISHIDNGGNTDSMNGSVKIDVCLSDSMSQKMNGNIEGIIKVLERMESDSISVEVSKIHK